MNEQTFDEKFSKEIDQMKSYLVNSKLREIGLNFTDGWNFKLSISQKRLEKLIV